MSGCRPGYNDEGEDEVGSNLGGWVIGNDSDKNGEVHAGHSCSGDVPSLRGSL